MPMRGRDRIEVLLQLRRLTDNDEAALAQFVLQDPLDAAMVDDPRVMHGVTPVAPADPALPSCRDVLVLTWKRGGVPG